MLCREGIINAVESLVFPFQRQLVFPFQCSVLVKVIDAFDQIPLSLICKWLCDLSAFQRKDRILIGSLPFPAAHQSLNVRVFRLFSCCSCEICPTVGQLIIQFLRFAFFADCDLLHLDNTCLTVTDLQTDLLRQLIHNPVCAVVCLIHRIDIIPCCLRVGLIGIGKRVIVIVRQLL